MRKKNQLTRDLSLSWIEEFTDWFARQERLCNRLLELTKEKRCVLLAGPISKDRVQSLNLILKEETALIAEAGALEEERTALYSRLGQEAGIDGRLIPTVPEYRERFAHLKAVLAELKLLNRENSEIMERFQRYVDFSLSMLERDAESGIYQAEGTKKERVKKQILQSSRIIRQV